MQPKVAVVAATKVFAGAMVEQMFNKSIDNGQIKGDFSCDGVWMISVAVVDRTSVYLSVWKNTWMSIFL